MVSPGSRQYHPQVPPGSCKLEPPLLVPMTEPLLSVMEKSSFPTEENTQFFPSVSLPYECLLLLPQNTHFWSPYVWGASLVAGSYNFTQILTLPGISVRPHRLGVSPEGKMDSME